jgi:hypothetical protein
MLRDRALTAGANLLAQTREGWQLARHAQQVPRSDALDAMATNVDLVMRTASAAGIPLLGLRTRFGLSPIVGVRRPDFERFRTALTQQASSTAFALVRFRDQTSRLQRAPHLRPHDSTDILSVDVFVHTVHQSLGRRFGREVACSVELVDDRPADGGLLLEDTRSDGPRFLMGSEASDLTEVTLYGHCIQSTRASARRSITEFDGVVDAVYLWVDDGDPAWARRRADRRHQVGQQVDVDVDPSRHRQFDELRYSLRSLARNAPWIRQIHLITDQQRPSWLRTEGTNLRVVDHRDFLPDSALPTFNSHAITAGIHRLSGLADHVLLMNDDVFLGRPVPPDRFFGPGGQPRFFLSWSGFDRSGTTALERARHHTASVVEAATGRVPTRVLRHTPIALSKPLLESLAQEFSHQWTSTVQSPFRSPDDIVPEWLHHFVGSARGATQVGGIGYGYAALGSPGFGEQLHDLGRRAAPDVFCVNDIGGPIPSEDEDRLRAFLVHSFPFASPYETPTAGGSPR